MNESLNYSLKTRAKTFHFASFFFSKEIKKEINTLYVFCRYVDDISDSGDFSKREAQKKLKRITSDLKKKKSKDYIVKDFIELMTRKSIQTQTPVMLIDGVIQDLGSVNLKSLENLVIYSYKVAGTVGLMICNILKVNEKKMKFKGIQLGIAMQITNILRDIDEDLNRNRIYFPNEYLTYKNSKPKEILKNKSLQKQFSKDLKKLKVFSDLIYSNSRIGIYKLPLKYRVAIGLASRLYQGIGIKIENNNYNIWGRRYYLSLFEKLVKSIFVLFEVLFVKNLKENKKLEKYINKTLFKLSKSYCD